MTRKKQHAASGGGYRARTRREDRQRVGEVRLSPTAVSMAIAAAAGLALQFRRHRARRNP